MDDLAQLAARIEPAPADAVTEAALARTTRRSLLIAAADGPRTALAAEPPSATFADAIADGTAAVVHAARDARASLMLVDVGCRKPQSAPWVRLDDDERSGIALVIGLCEATGLDLLLLGAFHAPIRLLTGAILAAASLQIPVVLDGDVTRAAADAAIARQPLVAGYLVRGLQLGHGEGTGAAMLLSRLNGILGSPASSRGGEVVEMAERKRVTGFEVERHTGSREVLDRLFVYGTMRQGQTARSMIANAITRCVPARATGTIYAFPMGYPGYTDTGSGTVIGEVLWLSELMATFGLLDAYEGADFARVIQQVTLETGEAVWAWVYSLADPGAAAHGTLIGDGDWVRYWTQQG